MASVTQVINGVSGVLPAAKQPRGGYLDPRKFKVTHLEDDPKPLNEKESVSAGIVGMAVDYLTRVETGTNVYDAFHVSFMGAKLLATRGGRADAVETASGIAAQIVPGLDDRSIVAACRLVNYDAVYRTGAGLPGYRWPLPEPDTIVADAPTCENIRTMVRRGVRFFDAYGPVTHDGLTFTGGYTEKVDTGDGDFMTADAVWDFKTNKKPPTNKHTLQICVYWLLGMHSIHHEDYEKVNRIGFVNPRLSQVITMEVADIPNDTLRAIQRDVIGYSDDQIIDFD
ncbi:MAG: hypothetical protein LKE27_11455 [Atopobiaceae bacterium]|jgi:hypothetical protein|nr:hypothetical protein [Atopobiaceae bacterium]